jgi:hypothetical protein
MCPQVQNGLNGRLEPVVTDDRDRSRPRRLGVEHKRTNQDAPGIVADKPFQAHSRSKLQCGSHALVRPGEQIIRQNAAGGSKRAGSICEALITAMRAER